MFLTKNTKMIFGKQIFRRSRRQKRRIVHSSGMRNIKKNEMIIRARNRGIPALIKAQHTKVDDVLLYDELEKLFLGLPRGLEIRVDYLRNSIVCTEYQLKAKKPQSVKRITRYLTTKKVFAFIQQSRFTVFTANAVRSIATTPFAMNGGITVQATVAVALPKKSTPFTFSVPVQKDVYYMYLEECFCTLKGKRKAGNVAVLFVAKDPVLFEIMLARDTARYERYLSFLPRFLNERRGKAKSFQLKCKTPPTVR